MRTRKLRLVSALLALAMMFVLLPTAAFAETIYTSGDYQYRLDADGKATITKYTGIGMTSAVDVVIPSDLTDENGKHEVVAIGRSAFNLAKMKSVQIPATVTLIDQYAFDQNWGLTEIVIPASVVTIEAHAFDWCGNIEKLEFSDGSKLQTIGTSAFYHCRKLVRVTLPKGLKTIQNHAFYDCRKLESVVIPNSVTEIWTQLFGDTCTSLKSVKYNGTAEEWANVSVADDNDVLNQHIAPLCTVTFDANGHGTAPATQQPYKGDALKAFEKPTAAGYTLAGWYDEDGNPFKVTSPVEKDMKLTAKWEKIPDHKLTVSGGTFAVDGTEVEGDSADVQEGAEVKVTFKKDSDAGSNVVFDGWEIEGLENAEPYQDKESFAFTMPKNGVTIAARTKTVEEDSDWDAGAVVTTAVLGTGMAVLAYHIGTEVYAEQVLGAGVAVPRTRGDVALKAWELAGKPAVENAAVAPEEAAQAQQWVLENGLMENQKDGTFHPEKRMSRLAALRVLDQAQKMG